MTLFSLNPHHMLRRLQSSQNGTAAIETAIGLSVFMIAILGVMEVGRLMWAQSALDYSVQQGARCMLVGTCTTANAPTTAAAASGFGFASSVFTATAAACGNQVTATYNFAFLTTLVVNTPLTLTATACM